MAQREIKFKRLIRYKDDGKLTWHYQSLIPLLDGDGGKYVSPTFFQDEFRKEASFEWVSPPLEFSGLMINGVDIYEGDRGSNEVAQWEVIFNKGCFCGKIIGGPDSDTHAALRAIVGFKYAGNIYEDKFKK